MKKKLEADLISLAHRILQLKNKEDVTVLQQEALKLYEKLSVLRFVEEHFGSEGPTIGKESAEEKIASVLETDTLAVIEEKPAVIEEEKEEQAVQQEKPEQETVASAEETEVAPDAETSFEPESEQPPAEETASEEAEESQSPAPEQVASVIEQLAAAKTVESEETPQSEITSPTLEEGAAFEQPEAVSELLTADAYAEEDLFVAKSEAEEEPKKDLGTEKPFTPSFELDFEAKPADAAKYDDPSPSFTFDDLLGKDYSDPVFVTQAELDQEKSAKEASEATKPTFPESASAPVSDEKPTEDIWSRRPFETRPEFEKPISSSLNEKLAKGITIGLNDRIAFMKNLFNNSSEDYNRVLSQLMTIDTYAEARQFIQEMVKPDYNDWKGKEEFEERFMEIVEKRFL